MKIRTKLNLVLRTVFVTSMALVGWLSYQVLHQNARDEVIQKAGIMLEAALSMRGYTVEQVKPLLEMQLQRAFLPQSVPAYAATAPSRGGKDGMEAGHPADGDPASGPLSRAYCNAAGASRSPKRTGS